MPNVLRHVRVWGKLGPRHWATGATDRVPPWTVALAQADFFALEVRRQRADVIAMLEATRM